MTEPRQILPQTTYMVTRHVSHDRELFDYECEKIKKVFMYCLAYAASKTEVQLHSFCVVPSSYFAVVSDPNAELPKFMHLLNRNVAMAVKVIANAKHAVFASGSYDSDVLEEEPEVVDAIVETLRAPLSIVGNLSDWTGLWLSPQEEGQRIKVERPNEYFSKNGQMPAELELVLTPPPCCAHWSPADFERELAARLEPEEGPSQESEQERETRRQMLARRIARWKAYRRFCAAYRRAIGFWRSLMSARSEGEEVDERQAVFPAGTYWMKRFCCVECQAGIC